MHSLQELLIVRRLPHPFQFLRLYNVFFQDNLLKQLHCQEYHIKRQQELMQGYYSSIRFDKFYQSLLVRCDHLYQ